MRLVIMIPAFNEEETIGEVIQRIPRNLADDVKVLVVDDGSTDKTLHEAKQAGADKIISFNRNRGLATAFREGLEAALQMNPDIIVNIDADGQYLPEEIPRLVKPIIEDKADIVLGSRFKGVIEDMSKRKRIGNILATKITGYLCGLPLSDAQTGFRALSKDVAMQLNIISGYTYTQELIIQAANKNMKIMEVPCTFNKRISGKSRLITTLFVYARRSGLTVIRTYRDFRPLRTFFTIGGIVSLLGLLVGVRVLTHFFLTGNVSPYLPSAILTAVLVIIGFQIMVLSLIADMIANNRRLTEQILYKLRKKGI